MSSAISSPILFSTVTSPASPEKLPFSFFATGKLVACPAEAPTPPIISPPLALTFRLSPPWATIPLAIGCSTRFSEMNVDVSGILRIKGGITPTKTRFLAGWAHTVGQQVLRVDYEPHSQITEAHRKKILQLLNAKLRKADALAISDYGFGVATPQTVKTALAHSHRTIPVSLDSRYQLTAYKRSGVTTATPNEAEIEALHNTLIGQNLSQLERSGLQVLSDMKLRSLVITRGKDGMAVFQPAQPTAHIPVHGSDQAVDVTGAGDTVLAAYTLGLAVGASPIEAAHIANIAGGLVVMKRGTATVSRHELLEAIRKAASEVAT